MHYHLWPMGFIKQSIPPYTVSAYWELFHCMNTTSMIEADSQRCIGVHFNIAHCCLVIFVSISLPSLNSSPSSIVFSCPLPPTPYLSQLLLLKSLLTPLHTSLPLFFLPSPFHLSLSPRAWRRFMAGDQSGEAR